MQHGKTPMSALRKPWLSPQEYLALERAAETRSEYVDGEIFAMAGGTLRHALIAANAIGEVRSELKDRPCLALGSDMKVWIEAANAFVYPDVSGLCGPVDTFDGVKDAYTNPSFIIEVLSDSTETYDREANSIVTKPCRACGNTSSSPKEAWPWTSSGAREPNGSIIRCIIPVIC